MPLITVPTPPIEIQIPNKVIANTILKRKAKLFTMLYNQSSKSLALSWQVDYYAQAANDTYGELVQAKGINSYSKEIIADNSVMVNPADGSFIYPDENGNYDEAVQRIGQYDFFYMAASTTPLQVHDMIIYHGQNSNWD